MPRGSNKSGLVLWEPGKSGNPNGRPKGSKNRSTIARKWLDFEETVLNPLTKMEEKLTQEDIITLALLKKARTGDVNAYNALMTSAHGLPKFVGVNGDMNQDEVIIIIE